MTNIKLDYLTSVFPIMLRYLNITLRLALSALLMALALGVMLAVIIQFKVKVLYQLSKLYVSFFRSTPFIAQLFLFYYGLPEFSTTIRDMSPSLAIIIVLGMNSSAYMAETIRGAINSVDKGQFEACLSVGMTNMQAMRRVIIPQAARVAIPSLSNSFIDLIKGTAVGFTIGVRDMMSKAQLEAGTSFRYMEVYIVTIIIYWVVVSFFGLFQKKLEERMNAAY